MPLLTRLLIKTGLLWFLASLIVGIVNRTATPPPIFMASWLHMLVVGWVSHLIFGVAFWMFPKFSKEQQRGPEWLGFIGYATLEIGLILRVIVESIPAAEWSPLLFIASALLQWVAGMLFTILIWPRIKGNERRSRKEE